MSLLLKYIAASGSPYTLSADPSSYTVDGSPAALQASYTLSASSGSYSVIGVSASATVNKALSADSGSYTVTGVDVAFEITAQPVTQQNGNVYTLRERIRRDDEECMRLVIEAFIKLAA